MRTETLNAEQRDSYEHNGYLLLDPLFSEAELAKMRSEADRLIETTVNASLATGEVSPRLDLQRREGKLVLRKIQPVNDLSEVFTEVASDERILRPLREILGADPALMEEKLNYKQILPGDLEIEAQEEGEAFPFHTDLAYFALDGYPRESLSTSLFIDETTAWNGPLRVLARSHLQDWPIQKGWPPLVEPSAVPEDQAVDILAPAGSLLIFHSALVHASSENQTDEPRRLMLYSHYPSTHEIEFDKRNRPLRERSREHESRYRQLADSGRFTPAFRMR
jgi:ectoine hydroxylase-related dioxygenase (phytanoyl-CoA dioxygenase family)